MYRDFRYAQIPIHRHIDGDPRVLDGDDDPPPVIDIGADEYVP